MKNKEQLIKYMSDANYYLANLIKYIDTYSLDWFDDYHNLDQLIDKVNQIEKIIKGK